MLGRITVFLFVLFGTSFALDLINAAFEIEMNGAALPIFIAAFAAMITASVLFFKVLAISIGPFLHAVITFLMTMYMLPAFLIARVICGQDVYISSPWQGIAVAATIAAGSAIYLYFDKRICEAESRSE